MSFESEFIANDLVALYEEFGSDTSYTPPPGSIHPAAAGFLAMVEQVTHDDIMDSEGITYDDWIVALQLAEGLIVESDGTFFHEGQALKVHRRKELAQPGEVHYYCRPI